MRNVGILISGEGEEGGLSILLRDSDPNTECKIMISPTDFKSCLEALDKMPVTEAFEVFGREDQTGVEVVLPQTFKDGSSDCEIVYSCLPVS